MIQSNLIINNAKREANSYENYDKNFTRLEIHGVSFHFKRVNSNHFIKLTHEFVRLVLEIDLIKSKISLTLD